MKKYLIYISFIFIIITCKSIDKDNEANLVVNYFSTHKAQLEKFKNITISKRSENNYIYGLDSIQVGLYLIKSNNDDSLFYISEISKNEVVSLLKKRVSEI